MKLINTKDRSYNGIRKGEEVEIKDQAQIEEYLEAGFEKAGKEEVKAVVKNAEVKKVEDEKKTPEDEKAGKEEVK